MDIARDEYDRIESIRDPYQQLTTFTYDGQTLWQVTDSLGRMTYFNYDSYQNLTSVDYGRVMETKAGQAFARAYAKVYEGAYVKLYNSKLNPALFGTKIPIGEVAIGSGGALVGSEIAETAIPPSMSVLRSGEGAASGRLSVSGDFGRVTTIDELLSSRVMPGQAGVVLGQRTVSFADLWTLSVRDNAEYLLTREGGRYVLRSGLADTVAIPTGVRPIVHTHPPDITGFIDKLPSTADINVLNSIWARNPAGPRPVSQIITGAKETTRFHATGLDLIQKPK